MQNRLHFLSNVPINKGMARRANRDISIETLQVGGLGVAILFPLILSVGGQLVTAIIGVILWLTAISVMVRLVATSAYQKFHGSLLKQISPAKSLPLSKSEAALSEGIQNPS